MAWVCDDPSIDNVDCDGRCAYGGTPHHWDGSCICKIAGLAVPCVLYELGSSDKNNCYLYKCHSCSYFMLLEPDGSEADPDLMAELKLEEPEVSHEDS